MTSDTFEKLYHTFRSVPKPTSIIGCTACCTNEAELKNLLKGVREADKFAISTLAHNGMSTVGSESDYKYFLPRILHEMSLDDDFWFLCMDALTGRIKSAGFETWSENQKTATLEGLLAIFDKYSVDYNTIDLVDWLYAVASVDFEVEPFLKVLDQPKNDANREILIYDVLIDIRSKEGEDVKFAHGSLKYEQYDPIYRWAAGKF